MKKKYKQLISVVLCIILISFSVLNINAQEFSQKNKTSEQQLMDNLNKMFFNEIPLMFQTDYPHIPYDTDTVAGSGCGISCLAMMATYYKNTEYTPDDLAIKYNLKNANNIERMEFGISDIGLNTTKTYEWNDLMQALKNGQPAIILVGSDSVFTDVGHFLIASELTADNKIIIKDPNKNNYKRDELKEGYNNGFSESVVRNGFFTAWIFPKKEPITIEDIYKMVYFCSTEKDFNKEKFLATKDYLPKMEKTYSLLFPFIFSQNK